MSRFKRITAAAKYPHQTDLEQGGSLYGRRVFCTDMTFVATVNPIMYEGGEPVFIDSEDET